MLCTEVGDAGLALDVVIGADRHELLAAPEALAGMLHLALTAGDNDKVAELQGDLEYLRGEWDDALRSYERAAQLGDPASARLARKRGMILYLRGPARRGRGRLRAGPRRRRRPARRRRS